MVSPQQELYELGSIGPPAAGFPPIRGPVSGSLCEGSHYFESRLNATEFWKLPAREEGNGSLKKSLCSKRQLRGGTDIMPYRILRPLAGLLDPYL